MEIKLVKFTNGEEILSEILESRNSDELRFKEPIRLVIMPPGKGEDQPRIGFDRWLPYAKDRTFNFNRKDIMLVVNPVEQFVKQYKDVREVLDDKAPSLVKPKKSSIILTS